MEKNPIYQFWWQGIENAPDIVKVCNSSLLKNYNDKTQKLIILDKNNLFDYITFPEYIMDKFNRGMISITHLSDLARVMLLEQTGGLWVDATMFFNRPINDRLFSKRFFTIKNPSANSKSITSKWECFLIGGEKNFPLFSLIKEMWLEYWKNEDMLIDYLLTDNIFYIGYTENEDIRKILDSCPTFHYRIDWCQRFMNSKYDRKQFETICENEEFIKLTYKGKLEKMTSKGETTLYGHLIKEYLL